MGRGGSPEQRGAPPGREGGNRLDAVVALTGGPAWLTDHVLGDHPGLSTARPASVGGYPSISVPACRAVCLPVWGTFIWPVSSEPRLLPLALSFEQAVGLSPSA